jgi:adenylosuccinate synthase
LGLYNAGNTGTLRGDDDMPTTVVVGGQFGSEGKGKITSHLALTRDADFVVRCGGPNSGHTYDYQGTRYVLRQVPCGVGNPRTRLLIAAGAIVDAGVLLKEIRDFNLGSDRIGVDGNAVVIGDADKQAEKDLSLGSEIGSTLSGTGHALARKMLRKDVRLVRHVEELKPYLTDVSREVNAGHDAGKRVIIEGTQGFGLSLHHGPYYPYVTSRDTTAAGFLSEVGMSPRCVDEIVMVIRTFPIRVGGNSGPLPNEITWEEVRRLSNYPHDIAEYTSVTKRLRRVAKFDLSLVKRAAEVNRPTAVAIHGLDYLSYSDFARQEPVALSSQSRAFIALVEEALRVPVLWAFTGPKNEEMVMLRTTAKRPMVAAEVCRV